MHSIFLSRVGKHFGETHFMLFAFHIAHLTKIDNCDIRLSLPVAMGYNQFNSKTIDFVPRVFESILQSSTAFLSTVTPESCTQDFFENRLFTLKT